MAAPRITVADIDKWNPDDIDRVFQVCAEQSSHCDDRASGLGSLSAFDSWDGDAAAAAKHSVGKTRLDFDSHGLHVSAIGTAAKTAATEVATVKSKLTGLRSSAQQQGFTIDPDGTVRPTLIGPFTAAEQQTLDTERTGLQLEVNQLLINAQIADSDLAAAINGADGNMNLNDLAKQNHAPTYADIFGLSSLGIPDYPDRSLDWVQTRSYYLAAEREIDALMDRLAKDPNMSLEERARIAFTLRNELRTNARKLMADQVQADLLFKNKRNWEFEDLIQDKMGRKKDEITGKPLTREQALQDVIDSSSTSNADVNAALGIDPKTAQFPVREGPSQFPDPVDVQAPPGATTGENIVAGVAGDSKLLSGLRIAGKAALPIAAGASMYEDYQAVQHGQETVPQAVGHSTGTIGGMMGGAALGATIGTAIGPEGTLAGGLVGLAGGAIGSAAGAISGGVVGKWIGGLF